MLLAHDHDLARERLAEAGFGERQLSDFEQPELKTTSAPDGTHVPHLIVGDLDAPKKLVEVAPYSTDVDSPHYRLRLIGHQTVLGADYCVIGTQAFNPSAQSLTRVQRRITRTGDFTALSDRVEAVVASYGIESVSAYGQSMGGDVSMQLAYNATFDENRGNIDVVAVGAHDIAKSIKRSPVLAVGVIKMMVAQATSGKALYDNVWESGSPALLEAWNLEDGEGAQEAQRKEFDKQLGKGVIRYWLSDVPANWALTRGFATPTTIDQAIKLASETDTFVSVGKQRDSSVMHRDGYMRLLTGSGLTAQFDGKLHSYADAGDHSDDDNIIRSAGRVLYFAHRAQEYLARKSA